MFIGQGKTWPSGSSLPDMHNIILNVVRDLQKWTETSVIQQKVPEPLYSVSPSLPLRVKGVPCLPSLDNPAEKCQQPT